MAKIRKKKSKQKQRHGQLLAKKMPREAETVINLGGQVFEALPRITPELLEQALDFLPVRTVMASSPPMRPSRLLPGP